MAGLRRRRKSGGVTYTSTNKGWTTSTSQGSGKRDGSGYRVTTTTKNGKTVVRRTTRSGDGWFKIEQQTLGKKQRYTSSSSSEDALGGCLVVVLLFVGFFIYAVIEYGL
ncbi:hypothetical protein OAU13_00670 [bacterium]|nr:hypothetical protein [bacterium]